MVLNRQFELKSEFATALDSVSVSAIVPFAGHSVLSASDNAPFSKNLNLPAAPGSSVYACSGQMVHTVTTARRKVIISDGGQCMHRGEQGVETIVSAILRRGGESVLRLITSTALAERSARRTYNVT